MANQSQNQHNSDEIDLGQLFQMIGRGFQSIFNQFLKGFLYIKRNLLILVGLVIVGVLAGYGFKQILHETLKTEVIVKPNLESKDYLYDVIAEIESNIKSKNESFFSSLEIDIKDLKGFKIYISAVEDITEKAGKEEMAYLELLQKFENTALVSDVLRAEILKNSSLNHRITFEYKSGGEGHEIAKKLVDYINSNNYFMELITVNRANSTDRIKKNGTLINQIDELINGFSNKLTQENSLEGRIILDNEEKLDIKGLFELKNSLIRDTEHQKISLKKQTEPISIINFGKSQKAIKFFSSKSILYFPLIFVGGFFLWSILKYLNKRAEKLLG